MTATLLVAMTALFCNGGFLFIWPFFFAVLWTHFTHWRYPQDSTAAVLIRLVLYGGIFAFFGGQPGIGADWILDAKTFNMVALIAASEAALQAWREAPAGLRFQPLLILQSGIIFLAACNTYNPLFVRVFTPAYMLCAFLALRDIRPRSRTNSKTAIRAAMRPRWILATLFVLVCGLMLNLQVSQNKDRMQMWILRQMGRRLRNAGGISNQPQLSSTYNMMGGTQRVLRIEGALNDDHLRAAAFDTYDNGRWSPTLEERNKVSFPESGKTKGEGIHTAHITKLIDINGLIVAPLNASAVTPYPGSSFDIYPALGPLHCEDPAPYTYDVSWSDKGEELGVPLYQGVLCHKPTAIEMQKLLQVSPSVDPRIHTLAQQITRDATDEPDKIEAIVTYLMTHHKYSRRVQRGRTDPISSFLLEKKNAHCEYFASAAVILMRCAGVPCRYVTGYMAHEQDGDETVVRSRDAHAWAEAYITGAGWVTVEATPADGTPEAQPGVSWLQRRWEKFQDSIARLRERMTYLSREQLFAFIIFVVLVWVAERWRQSRRRKALEQKYGYNTPEELARLAERFENTLKKRRITLPDGKPWSEVFQETDTPAEYEEFIGAYNRARFGGELSPEQLKELQHILNSIEKGQGHASNR